MMDKSIIDLHDYIKKVDTDLQTFKDNRFHKTVVRNAHIAKQDTEKVEIKVDEMRRDLVLIFGELKEQYGRMDERIKSMKELYEKDFQHLSSIVANSTGAIQTIRESKPWWKKF